MAERAFPYAQFNFILEAEGLTGGFQDISGISLDVTVTEYRTGDSKVNAPIKVNTLHKVGDVTLKRGVVGADSFWKWINTLMVGKKDARGSKVTIKLMDETNESAVMTWVLQEARPIKYTAPSLSAKGTEIAIEELTLAYERLEVSA